MSSSYVCVFVCLCLCLCPELLCFERNRVHLLFVKIQGVSCHGRCIYIYVCVCPELLCREEKTVHLPPPFPNSSPSSPLPKHFTLTYQSLFPNCLYWNDERVAPGHFQMCKIFRHFPPPRPVKVLSVNFTPSFLRFLFSPLSVKSF